MISGDRPALAAARLFLFSFLSLYLCGLPAFAEGPLFIQTHYTNHLCGINPGRLETLLSGRAKTYRDLGGGSETLRIYADSRIAPELARAYPALRITVRDFSTDDSLASIPGFLGISDVRGLRPHFRALSIDGTLPWGRLREDYSLASDADYRFRLRGAEEWEREDWLIVVQTGVTAMTRAFIAAVDRAGDALYPVRDTMGITSQADIATTSNEVSFLEPCTYPLKNRMSFCSPLRFFKILTASGFDVIELTGNHNNDYGRGPNVRSMEMMERAGMVYFGGGRNRAQAEAVRYVTARGRRIAFVGFNEIGPEGAWASETRAGAARLSAPALERALREARPRADIVFLSIQCGNENDAVPWQGQMRMLRRAAELGADIIVSSSAHRPMGIEFYNGKFISYGLGNFLFDQMQTINHRRGVIVRHHFHRGRHAQTELLPYLIHDYCRPKPVRGREARELMDEIYRLSPGNVTRATGR